MKPKLWDGPNAVGEARARFNETLDTPYTTASGPGFTARKMNGFSEVTGVQEVTDVAEPALFCTGYAGDNLKRRGAVEPGQSFQNTIIRTHSVGLGNGYGAEAFGDREYATETRTVYTKRDMTDPAPFSFGYYTGPLIPAYYKRAALSYVEIPDTETAHITYNIAGYAIYRILPMGRQSDTDEARNMVLHNVRNGEVDEWGFPTSRVRFLRVTDGCATAAMFDLPLPPDAKGVRNYMLGQSFTFGPDSVCMIVLEMPRECKETPDGAVLDTRLVDPGDASKGSITAFADAQGRILLYKTTDGGGSWSIIKFTGLDEMVTHNGGTEPLLGYHVLNDARPNLWATYSGNIGTQGIRLTDIAMLTNFVVLSQDVWVMFTTFSDQRVYAGGYMGLRSVALRTTDGGISWTTLTTPLSGTGPEAFTYDCEGVALRENVALVRAARGMAGLGRPIRFIRTTDKGETWEEITPTGLPATTNERIGYFEVLKVDEQNVTTVAVVCYSNEDQAYIMYVSEDDGATWEKSRTVAHADYFRRVDIDDLGNPSNDTMANFGRLDYRGTTKNPKPLDIAQPWRFDATITPPSS